MNVTIKDIARLAGASPTAVSFVLNGKDEGPVSAAKRAAILDAVRRMGYRRSSAAKGLTQNRSYRIAICTAGGYGAHPLIGSTSHHEGMNLAAQRLHDAGYGIAPVQIDVESPQTEIARKLQSVEADGFMFVDVEAQVLDRILFSLTERRVPAVAMGTAFRSDAPWYSWAAIDRGGSFEVATKYLLDQGLRRIAMLDTDVNSLFTPAKRVAYERVMITERANVLPLFRIASATARAAQAATKQLLSQVPDVEAVMLTDNLFAPVVQLALNNPSIRLLGFGDESFARLCDPPLSFMRLPLAELSETCVTALLEKIENPDGAVPIHELIACDLVIRET